ncbi:MAG: YbaB/EbfC family nucleoid-associated protein [Candidatus Portiera sp.]|nr:YbaB/EbfC family nucleoid-associated protein [Portiera sp.]
MDLKDIMKQAGDMKEKLEEFNKNLADIRVEASSGIDMVSVTMDGNGMIVKISLSDVLLKEDKAVQESLIQAALNDATKKVKEKVAEKQKSLIGLPSMMDFPFK